MLFSRGFSQPRGRTQISYASCIGRWVLCYLRHLGSPIPLYDVTCSVVSNSLWPQAPLSVEFSRQEYCCVLPIPFSRGSSWPRDRSSSPALQADSLLSEPQRSPFHCINLPQFIYPFCCWWLFYFQFFFFFWWLQTMMQWTFLSNCLYVSFSKVYLGMDLDCRVYASSIYSLQFSHSVVSDSLWPHGLKHARFPCPSPTPGACSNSCPLSWWCHLTISSSVHPCNLLGIIGYFQIALGF